MASFGENIAWRVARVEWSGTSVEVRFDQNDKKMRREKNPENWTVGTNSWSEEGGNLSLGYSRCSKETLCGLGRVS